MARKYLIETFGCQMNVHDSERMAGLLEQAGFEATDDAIDADVVVINTCSVRERAEEKLYTRLGELRQMAAEQGHHPIVAVAGCVAQQEGDAILKRSPGVADVILGTQAIRRLPMLVQQAAEGRRPVVNLDPYDDVTFPLGVTRRADPLKAYVTIIEGCNEFCSFCVVPYTRGHERMRPKADILAEVREAAGTGHREVQLLGQIVNHYDAPDDPACDFSGLLEAIHEVAGIERIRFASPHPRHVSPRFLATMARLPKICRHLHLPVQSGSTRVLEAMRRRYTREGYLELVGADPCTAPGRRAVDRYDRRVSRRDRRRFRRHAVADRRGPVPQHVLVQVLAASEHAGGQAARGRCAGGREDAADRGAAGAAARDPERAERAPGRAEVDVLVDAASRRRETELSGRTSTNVVVNLPGPAAWIGRTLPVRIERAGPHSVWGQLTAASATPTFEGPCKSR